jgi:uncharacterized protein (TIGR02996 family)
MQATVEAFKPVLPPEVREVIAQAEQGQGALVVWLRGMAPLPLSECLRMLNETRVPSNILGWLIGMTLFGGDPRAQLAGALGKRSFRDDVIPHVLLAFAAGVLRCGQTANPRLWTAIEMLAARGIPEIGRRRTGEFAAVAPRRTGEIAVPDEQALAAGEALVAICETLPIAIASKYAMVRGIALRLAFELGAPARAALETAQRTAPAALASLLSEALVALAGGEPAPASGEDVDLLRTLLAAWATSHDPALERAIARVGADLGRVRGPIVARSFGELEGTWHAVASNKDPIDVARLLELKFPGHWKRALERVNLLSEFAADPRIAIRLSEVARLYTSRSSRPLHVAIGRVLADAPTRAALPGIEAVVTTHADAYQRAREAIAATAVHPADPSLLARAGGDGPDVDALYAQHTANPGDLDARLVLADALQGAGDPRGELIMLQMALADGTASEGAERRVASLLHNHADEWVGPLPAIERTGRRFERGFLVACETNADHAAIARTLDRPEWRTIEELSLRAEDVELAPLIARLPLLRRLCADDRSLAQLAATSRPLPQLEVVFARGAWQPPPGLFPSLRVFGGSGFTDQWNVATYRAQLRLAAELGMHALVYTAFPRNQLAVALSYASSGPPEVRFTLARHRGGFDPLGWRLRVRRESPVIEVAWTYHRWAESIVAEVFEPLAATRVPKIALHMPDMLRVHLDRLIRERPFGIEVVPGHPIDLIAC